MRDTTALRSWAEGGHVVVVAGRRVHPRQEERVVRPTRGAVKGTEPISSGVCNERDAL